MSTDPRSRGWVEVNTSALRRNLARIRSAVGEGVGVLPLVKANAYGIGIERAVRALEVENPWGYGVATVDEGLSVKEMGIARPVVVLSPAPQGSYRAGISGGLAFSVSTLDAVRELAGVAAELGVRVGIHVEVDTGMGRSGFDWRTVEGWGRELSALAEGSVSWEGIFTHFHSADRWEDPSVGEQLGRFEEALAALGEKVGGAKVVHLGNSAAALGHPATAGAMVRPGIFLYGGRIGAGFPEPEEVVTVRARVVLVRRASAGTTVGYGAEYRAAGEERWATVGIGYGDGLPRALGNRGDALIRGRRVPIVGRISMDLTVVDISKLSDEIRTGEVATFIGTDGAGRISLEEVADLAGTINYEILTGLSPRLPRVGVEDGPSSVREGIDYRSGRGKIG